MALLTQIRTRNYRSLADVTVDVGALTVLFGPNGSGKSTFLDTVWFIRDCAVNGVDEASTRRDHGIGLLWDGADDGAPIGISLTSARARYELQVSLSSGRIDPLAGERLYAAPQDRLLIERDAGQRQARFTAPGGVDEPETVRLREPNKLSLGRYLDRHAAGEVAELDQLLRATHWHHARSFRWWALKKRGSDSGPELSLEEDGRNLWSALRNLEGRRKLGDDRYDTILRWMREAFPDFRELVFDQTGNSSLYCSFLDARRRVPVAASGVSDGHLAMLLLLTALFAEGRTNSLLLLDEPELSLHPWPLAVLARAMHAAANEWGRQIMLATHSPVLLSQFATRDILGATLVDGQTHLRRVSEMTELQDLLEQYAVGSLYMAEAIAPQGPSQDPSS